METHNYKREQNIQRSIMLWCGQNDILCFRTNVGRVQTIYGDFFDTGLPEGWPDLIILYNHTIYFCEVKTRTGAQRNAQKRFQEMITKRGYTYFVARSIDDVKIALNL